MTHGIQQDARQVGTPGADASLSEAHHVDVPFGDHAHNGVAIRPNVPAGPVYHLYQDRSEKGANLVGEHGRNVGVRMPRVDRCLHNREPVGVLPEGLTGLRQPPG